MWKTCQAFSVRYQSVVFHSKALPPLYPQRSLACFLPRLGILIIGDKKQKRPRSSAAFSVPRGESVPVPAQSGCLTREGLTAATFVTGRGRLCDKRGCLCHKHSRLCYKHGRRCNKDGRLSIDPLSNTSSPAACCRARQYQANPSQINRPPAVRGGGGGGGVGSTTL
jgi:hypothetical protein